MAVHVRLAAAPIRARVQLVTPELLAQSHRAQARLVRIVVIVRSVAALTLAPVQLVTLD
jgi:hypothetical protein